MISYKAYIDGKPFYYKGVCCFSRLSDLINYLYLSDEWMDIKDRLQYQLIDKNGMFDYSKYTRLCKQMHSDWMNNNVVIQKIKQD